MKSKKVLVICQAREDCDYDAILRTGLEYCHEKDGLKVIEHLDADMVILDCGHRTDTSVMLLKSLKQSQSGMPVIFVADASSEELVMEVFKSGVRDYFKKPLNRDEFRKTVESVLLLREESLEQRRSLTLLNHEQAHERMPLSGDVPENILRSVRFIEKNFLRPLTLDQIARVAFQSKFHFTRQFKRFLGVSPIQYMLSLRISMAKHLLKRKEYPVAVVAMRCGFNDLSEFNKQFKKSQGVSPSVYRSSLNLRK